MISKNAARKYDKIWHTLSDAGKKRLMGSGVMKSKQTIANGLYKKFIHMNDSELDKLPHEYYNKLRQVGVDHAPGSVYSPLHYDNNLSNEVNLKNRRITEEIRAHLNGAHVKLVDHSVKDPTALLTGGYSTTHVPSGEYPSIKVVNPNNVSNRALSPLHKMVSKPEDRAIAHNIGALHELYEAKSVRKKTDFKKIYDRSIGDYTPQARIFKDTGKKVNSIIARARDKAVDPKAMEAMFPLAIETPKGTGAMMKGNHHSLSVLGNEANDMRRINTAGYGASVKHLKKLRDTTGEYALLERLTGKKPGVDKFTKKDLAKLDSGAGRSKFRNTFNPSREFEAYSV